MLDDQGRSESENPVIPENEENPEDSGISGKTPQPKRRGGFIRATLLASRAGSSVREEMKHIRLSHLRYMLIFSLAPIFPNMKNSLIADRVLGLDGVYAMGIAYCLGLGLLFLVRNTDKLARFARRLALITAAFFLAWILLPQGLPSRLSSVLFSLGLGGCSGVSLYAFTYALNDGERLVGAALACLFCLLSQVIYSLFSLWQISGPLYLGTQVLVTAVCLAFYRQGDFGAVQAALPSKFSKPLATMLFVFFAHRAVVFFYSYLPASLPRLASEFVGILIFLLSLLVFFTFRFKLWHMCNLFFIGMLAAYAARIFLPGEEGLRLSETFSAFSFTGFMASYYLLGFTLSRHADFRLFKRVLFLLFNASLLLHVIPGAVASYNYDAMPTAGALVTLILFVAFVISSPAMFQPLYQPPPQAPIAMPDAEEERMARRQALMDRYAFTPREQDVAKLLLKGYLFKQCADQLGISADTVKYHARNIYQKPASAGGAS